MCEPELQDIEDEVPDFSGENDRREEARRVSKDRRGLIRYELEKGDRRLGDERRKVTAGTKDDMKLDLNDTTDSKMEDESVLDVVIGKITNLFGR